MVENIYLVQELVRKYAKKRVSPICKLKIDLKKAYDSVSWKFLNEMLVQLNFPQAMANLIMECVSATSYFISLNGGYFGFFEGRKGLRPGDPLSALLFVIYLEYLSRLLKSLEENSNFNFHPRCEHLKITHLAFADDLITFSRGDFNLVKLLLDCLGNFTQCSGLIANCLKSNLFSAGVKNKDLDGIKRITKFNEGEFPFRYLGIPLAALRLNFMHYSPMINKITSLLNG
ncbi:uncharacterized protein LOC131147253 [Malania oleifera]|uniref:uncharacterized protein LOC131147253 n=1 Tax=Malania oleifera TaxID=397392 RepID=UPI0025ADE7BD|nr:uncharacterized protein LOC131147253 [Malania oleifera]